MQEKTLLNQANSTSNIHSSEFGSVSYDIFGSPYQKSGSFLVNDSLDFGYLGKPYNGDTELYDYGFRDYSPEIARFTTVDPIRLIKQDDSIARLIVVAHGDQFYGYLWGIDNKELSIKDATVPVIDMVGCYASKNKELQNSTVKVNTYNPGCTTPTSTDDDQILFYQTNEVIKKTIPAAIESGNINSTKEPSKNSFLDTCVSIFQNLF